MADNKLNNYTLIELIHLSYLIRDSLEYCHAQINVTEEKLSLTEKFQLNVEEIELEYSYLANTILIIALDKSLQGC